MTSVAVIMQAIEKAMKAGSLRLPALPDVVLRIREVMAREEFNIADLAKIIQADPVVTTRLIEIANSADRALMAGLLHNIGALPVCLYLDLHPELEKELLPLLDQASPLAVTLLSAWDFDDDMIAVVAECGDTQRFHDGAADYCDAVIVSRALERVSSGQMDRDELMALPAVAKFPVFHLGSAAIDEIMDEAREELQELSQMLATPADAE